MIDHDHAELMLHLATGDELVVEAASGSELVNDLYEYRVELVTDRGHEGVASLVGRHATLAIRRPPKRRAAHGIVRAAEVVGERKEGDERRLQVVLELVPRAHALRLSHGSRVFEGARVPQVIRQVLTEHGVPSMFLLADHYPVREYITQYEESDWDFLCRLAAELGIISFFVHPWHEVLDTLPDQAQAVIERIGGVAGWSLDGEVLIFADRASSYHPIDDGTQSQALQSLLRQGMSMAVDAAGDLAEEVAGDLGVARDVAEGLLGEAIDAVALPSLPFHHDGVALETRDERIYELQLRKRFVTSHARFREFDPSRPLAMLEAHHSHGHDVAEEIVDAVTDAVQGQPPSTVGLEAIGERVGDEMAARRHPRTRYEHHSHFHEPNWEYEQHEPERILRSERRDEVRGTGQSDCPWLSAGHRFQLTGHPDEVMNGDYVVVSVEHRWSSRTMSDAEERSISNRFVCVPASTLYVPKRPKRRSVQSCETAIVIGDGRIHTNERGQVKVRFHWDRRSGDASTCWLRTMQSWSGAGFGTQFIPRVGSEVVVGFERGDPDRPIVLGGVYNAISPPPFPLPERKTVSGLHTRSVPDGGHNELTFDDEQGREQVYLRAERDLRLDVEHDRSIAVKSDERHVVHGTRSLEVHGPQEVVLRSGRELTITGTDTTRVRGRRDASCEGDVSDAVSGDASRNVGGRATDEVHGGRSLRVGGDEIRRIEGSAMCIVGSSESRGTHATHVDGDVDMFATGSLQLTAEQDIVLRCGETTLRLSPDRAVLSSPEVMVAGRDANVRLADGELRAAADTLGQLCADKVVLKSSGAAVGLSSEAAIDGSRVLLNSPESADDRVEETPDEPTTIELTDHDGNPIPHQPFLVRRADGSTISGALDGEGKATIYLDDDAEISFVGLTELRSG